MGKQKIIAVAVILLFVGVIAYFLFNLELQKIKCLLSLPEKKERYMNGLKLRKGYFAGTGTLLLRL